MALIKRIEGNGHLFLKSWNFKYLWPFSFYLEQKITPLLIFNILYSTPLLLDFCLKFSDDNFIFNFPFLFYYPYFFFFAFPFHNKRLQNQTWMHTQERKKFESVMHQKVQISKKALGQSVNTCDSIIRTNIILPEGSWRMDQTNI